MEELLTQNSLESVIPSNREKKLSSIYDKLKTLTLDEIDSVAKFIAGLSQPNDEEFEKFWAAYPKERHGSKRVVKKKWDKLRPPFDIVMFSLTRQLKEHEGEIKFFKLAETWLNKYCWEIESTAIDWKNLSYDECRARLKQNPKLFDAFQIADPSRFTRWDLMHRQFDINVENVKKFDRQFR